MIARLYWSVRVGILNISLLLVLERQDFARWSGLFSIRFCVVAFRLVWLSSSLSVLTMTVADD